MTRASPEDVVGELERRVVEAIIATGATRAEITEALAALDDECNFDDARRRALTSVAYRESNVARGRD